MYRVVFSNGNKWMVACYDMGNTSYSYIENAFKVLKEIKEENPSVKVKVQCLGVGKWQSA
jgi:hypothetical protein